MLRLDRQLIHFLPLPVVLGRLNYKGGVLGFYPPPERRRAEAKKMVVPLEPHGGESAA